MNNKKGISAVVATVLIILITIAAIAMVWTIVRPFIIDTTKEAVECFKANTALAIENKGFTCFNAATIDVQVSHGSNDVGLVGIQFLISKGGDTTSVEEKVIANLPGINGERVINVAYAAGSPDSVSIAPIITVGNAETTCDVSAPVVLAAC